MDFILLDDKSCNMYQEESDAQDIFNYFVIQSKDKELDFFMTLDSAEICKPCILLDTKEGNLSDDDLIWGRIVNKHTKNYEKWSELVSKTEDKNLKEISLLEEGSIESVLIDDKYVFDMFSGEIGLFMFFYDKAAPCKRIICDDSLFDDDAFDEFMEQDSDNLSIKEVETIESAFEWFEGMASLYTAEKGNKASFERTVDYLIEKYNEIFSK